MAGATSGSRSSRASSRPTRPPSNLPPHSRRRRPSPELCCRPMADCQLCGGSHPDDRATCPQSRTGQQLADKYVLGPLLGIGGIAAVYAARHPVLGHELAVKILHKRFAKDAELSARFVREARETAALGHPAFVRVYDAGTTHDGCAFIEMDRLAGHELYSLRKAQGPFAPERVVHIAIGVLDALAALHARGVIHRDLKTQNIYI